MSADPDRSDVAWGSILMNQSDGELSWATVVNGCAEHTWWRPPEDPENRLFRARLSAGGERILMAEHNREHRPDRGVVHELDIAKDEIVRTTRAPEVHHDFQEWGDGQLAWISWQYLENEWFTGLLADVVTDAIRTAPLGTNEVTDDRLFSLADDAGLTPWWTCFHMSPTEQIPGFAEWSHSNSLVWDAERERFYLYVRYWDALVAVERTGRLAWMLGGPRSDFELVGDTELPMHAHLSEAWDGGLLAFDNRNHHESGTSRVVELAWDEDAGTVEEVWSYDDGTFDSFLGDARRLPSGNVLIVYSTQGRMTEVTRDGEVVWEAVTDGRLSRVEFHPSWPPG